MSQNTQLQERYGQIVEAKLRSSSIFSNLFNHRYEGTPKAGAVKIPVRAEATARAYDITNGASNGTNTYGLTVPTTSYTTLVLDNDYAVNELIDGYVAAAVPDGMVADRLDSAGYALALKLDSDLVAALKSQGTTPATQETDIIKQIVDTIAEARAAKVNPASMWIAVAPATMGKIYKSDYFVAVAHTADLKAGEIGALMGVPVYVTANLTGKDFIVGNTDYCHCVEEWAVPCSVNDLSDGVHIGCSAVQGRMIYGFAITKPATIFVK